MHCHPHELDLQNFLVHTLAICPAHMTMIDTRYNYMSQKKSNIMQSIHSRIHQLVQHSNPNNILIGLGWWPFHPLTTKVGKLSHTLVYWHSLLIIWSHAWPKQWPKMMMACICVPCTFSLLIPVTSLLALLTVAIFDWYTIFSIIFFSRGSS
jgi:hypothetical protein